MTTARRSPLFPDPIAERRRREHDAEVSAFAERLTRGLQSLDATHDVGPVVDLHDLLRNAPPARDERGGVSHIVHHGIAYDLKVSTRSLRVWVAASGSWDRAWRKGRHLAFEVYARESEDDGWRWRFVPPSAVPPSLTQAAWRELLAARAAQSTAA